MGICSHGSEAMGMPRCSHVSKFVVGHQLHEVIDDFGRGCLHCYSNFVLHVEKAGVCIGIVWKNCEVMETLLGCLDVF